MRAKGARGESDLLCRGNGFQPYTKLEALSFRIKQFTSPKNVWKPRTTMRIMYHHNELLAHFRD